MDSEPLFSVEVSLPISSPPAGEQANGAAPPLPLALREQEISEKDAETLLRCAQEALTKETPVEAPPRKVPLRSRKSNRS